MGTLKRSWKTFLVLVAMTVWIAVIALEMSWLWTIPVVTISALLFASVLIVGWLFRVMIMRMMILPAALPAVIAKRVLPNVDLDQLRAACMSVSSNKNDSEDVDSPKINLRPSYTWHVASIRCEDGYALDGMVYKSPRSKNKWVIMFLGNGAYYEVLLNEARDVAIALGRNVLIFNYRGVGRSEGIVFDETDLVRDGRACVAHLRNQENVTDTSDVLLFGHSLGGAIATLVFAEPTFRGHLINDRSFSSLHAVPNSWIANFGNTQRGVLSLRAQRALSALVRWTMRSIRWNLDAFDALRKMEYSAEKWKRALVIYHRRDEIISFQYASMYSAMERELGSPLPIRTIELKCARVSSPHNVSIANCAEWRVFVDAARELLQQDKKKGVAEMREDHGKESKVE